MQPSKYQQAVLDAVLTGSKNLMIQAVAGSGKTSTLVMICEALKAAGAPPQTLALAFNKEIAEAMKKKLPSYVTSSTFHSCGFSTLMYHFGKQGAKGDFDGSKVKRVQTQLFGAPKVRNRLQKEYVEVVDALTSLLRNTCTEVIWKDIESLAYEYDVQLDPLLVLKPAHEVCTDIRQYLEALRKDTTMIDFDDMLDLVVHYKLTPRTTYDLILVDESQDLNKLQADFLSLMLGAGGRSVHTQSGLDALLGNLLPDVNKVAKPARPTDGRVIFVGDRRQAIYKFRGADASSMKNLAERFGTVELPLSICYRCASNVVGMARNIIGPNIEAAPTAKPGLVRHALPDEVVENLLRMDKGDLVLCRVNAPLLSYALKLIGQGTKATVRGRDIGKSLIKVIDTVECMAEGPGNDDFLKALQTYCGGFIDKAIREEKYNQATTWADKYLCIATLVKDIGSPEGVKDELTDLFSDETHEGVVFSSIHKAKGLEAPRAMILMPNLLPHPMVFKSNVVEVGLEQERNLAYVAVTRAMSELIIQPVNSMDLEDCPFGALAEIGRTTKVRRAAKGDDAVMYGQYLNVGGCAD